VHRQRRNQAGAQVRDRAHVQTTPRLASSPTRPGSSTARIPWRIRSAASASSAPRTEAGPAASPACGTDPDTAVPGQCERPGIRLRRVLRFRAAKTEAHHAAVAVGDRVARGQLRRLQRVATRGMSGVSRTCTPCSSAACWAPSQYPVNTSSQPTPRPAGSAGVKMPSR
jgi:hypothetical protein